MPHTKPTPIPNPSSDLPKSGTHKRRPKPAPIAVSAPHPSSNGLGTPYPHGRPHGRPSAPERHPRPSPAAAATMILSPRPFEDLCNERTYLLSCLQSHEAAVGGLARRYSTIEQRLARATLDDGPDGSPPPNHVLREDSEATTTKDQMQETGGQLQSLRGRIAGKVGQQKAILVRLGELHVEIQSRERINAAQLAASQAKMQQGYWPLSPVPVPVPVPVVSMSAGFYGPVPSPTSPISPMSALPMPYAPGAFPVPMCSPYMMQPPGMSPGWYNYDPWGQSSAHQAGPIVPMPPLTGEIYDQYGDEHQNQHQQSFQPPKGATVMDHQEAQRAGTLHQGMHAQHGQEHKWPSRSVSAGDESAPQARDQRLSLPTVRGVWPE